MSIRWIGILLLLNLVGSDRDDFSSVTQFGAFVDAATTYVLNAAGPERPIKLAVRSHPQALICVFSTVCHIARWNAHGSVSVLMQQHWDTHLNRHDEIFACNVRPLPPAWSR